MFFFFQAEDGIRDKLVTGVQTCALPISKGLPENKDYSADAPRRGSVRDRITPRRCEGIRAEESGGHGPSPRHSTGLPWSNLSQPHHFSRGGGGLSFQDRASRGPAHVAGAPSASTRRRRKINQGRCHTSGDQREDGRVTPEPVDAET